MAGPKSTAAFERAKRVLPGGVNSPVRAFKSVHGTPFFADKGEGPYLYDIDGNRYVDYLMSWGPLIWGHAHPQIVAAVQEAASKGTSFGVPTELETDVAQKIVDFVPSIDVVRMVNSGTEATMSAVRVARAATSRSYVVKFIGCYHGHADHFLVKAGSGVADLGLPDSPGVPKETAERTIAVPYNDIDALRDVFLERGEEIAAVIIEPVAGNMGCVLPRPGYLQAVRELTRSFGTLLIFDEVITGFRVGLGGAQARFDIEPDLTTFGKVIGAGLPVGAYGGRRDLMEMVAPSGPVYQGGTLSGNPLAMSAGLVSLNMLEAANREGFYDKLQAYGQQVVDQFVELGKQHGIPTYGHAIGGLYGLFFHEGPVYDFEGAMASDGASYERFFHAMLENGVTFAPSPLESAFVSGVHTSRELEITLGAMKAVFAQLTS
ncbi:glutamate-1-semialdehyde 2,1-aminomutase [Alicyclobacillus fastidiosus]|uniref:Glutamate-1-semialdehyde 2,1-aminomutase n=1 Tax=Alicyclobacillus fastidiosus TaxID=392011 RepID=A0ABY6ZQ08_9BACL|nr:glutamate-1-semialdehyde 2,1-aminomutase [Alicyclobacillus fastidiosus]WAH44241.1 glutamate-1-semialdehyde 2,1-aminomutase [Alicyclobacillus fastidiosus]GMA60561.1 glutamate-1-semialdehyde 2,1-aminomutase [Alicyclobacillus fastidiosus]